MTETVKQLDAAERARLDRQVQALEQAPAPVVDAHSGRHFVFVAHFDGTNNDKDHLEFSGSDLPTNVAELWSQMRSLDKANDNLYSQYYKGVGAANGPQAAMNAAFTPTADMRSAAEEAYADFREQALIWLKQHPEAKPTEALQVMATGFSRGGGTAAVFSQMLYERGLTDQAGKVLVPPGQLGLAGAMIYDPVTTGYAGNSAFSPTSRHITVVQAQNEYRSDFKGVDHRGHPGVTVVPVTGNHCNIGGGYDHGIGARVLEASTAWMQKAGVPVAEVPKDKRSDGTAVVYHERDLPYTDQVAAVSRHPAARAISPLGSWSTEKAAQAADYPVTHDPRKGIDAPRELDDVAREERKMADGWRRFDGAQGTVWRKDYVNDKGVPLTAVVVERDAPGKAQDRVDLFLMRGDRPDEVLLNRSLPAGSGDELRQSLDARMAAASRQRTEVGGGASEQQLADAQRFKDQLGARLQQLGMSEAQIEAMAAAAAKACTRHADQGAVTQFHLKQDGSSVAMVQGTPPVREFSVADALSQSADAHWQELTAQTSARQRDGDAVVAQAPGTPRAADAAAPSTEPTTQAQGARSMG